MEPSRPTPPWVRALLVALLAVSLGLRLWYAHPRPDSGRNYDERFGFRNITSLLRDGSLEPRQAYYPSLSYWPQAAVLAASEALHRATGIAALSIYAPTSDGYSPTAYRLARGCVALFGVTGLLATYAAGRRLFSPAVGLLGAAFLSIFSRHLVSSSHFKPDTLATCLTALVLFWSVPAARRPSLRGFLKVGAGIGLAVSAKYTAIASALPITAAVLCRLPAERRRDPRQALRLLGWLALAGLTSAAVFVALNPFVALVFQFVPRLVHGYAERGQAAGSGHLVVLREEALLLATGHGWAVAALVVLGTAGLAARLLARDTPESDRSDRIEAALLLGGFLGYSLLHAAFMTFFRPQNYLPAIPFTSLIAAWAGVELWRALARRLPAGAARPATVAAVALVALLVAGRQADWVYRHTLPSTWEVAERVLRTELAPLGLRHVVYERGTMDYRVVLQGRERGLATEVASLARADPALLDGSDAELFPKSRLEGPDAEPYLRRGLAVGGERIRRVEPRRFESHGEALVIYLHPWRQVGPPVELAVGNARGRPMARLPAAGIAAAAAAASSSGRPAPAVSTGQASGTAGGATVLSLVMWVPAAQRYGADALVLRPGQVRLPLTFTGQRQRRARLATLRFPAPAGPARVELPGQAPPGVYRLLLHRWASPWTGADRLRAASR